MASTLSPLEAKLLALQPLALSMENAARSCGESPDALRRAAEQLREAGLLNVEREEAKIFEYTPQGMQAQKDGLPELRLIIQLAGGPKPLASFDKSQIGVGMAVAVRSKFVEITPDKQVSLTDSGRSALEDKDRFTLPPAASLSSIEPARLPDLIRRGLVRERTAPVKVTTAPHASLATDDVTSSSVMGRLTTANSPPEPPATGGMSASSSPGPSTVCAGAISWLTAVAR